MAQMDQDFLRELADIVRQLLEKLSLGLAAETNP